MRVLSVMGLLTLLVGYPAAGQELECQGNETLREAFDNRVNQQLVTARAEALTRARAEALTNEVAKESTSGAAPGSAASLRDLLSFLVTSVDLGDLSEEGKSLVFDLNPENLRLGETGDLGIRAVIHDPELFKPLMTAVEEAGDTQLLSTLHDSTEELDDLELSVTWERKSKLFGREIDQNAEGTEPLVNLLSELHAQAIKESTSPSEATQRLLQKLQSLASQEVTPDDRCSQAAAAVRQGVAEAADEAVDELVKVRATLKGIQFHSLADLLNNQRQLYVTGSYRKRAPAVGREEASVEAKYEHSFASLSGARKSSYGETSGWDFKKLKSYIEKEDGKLKYAPRLTFSASYTWLDEYAPPEVASAIDLSLDEAERWSVTASFGIYLSLAETADGALVGATRFDLEARYDDYSDDAAKRDRAVVTATLVQPLIEKLSATVGAVWVNKPEFLEQFLDEDDDGLSAHVGFKFTLDKDGG